MFSRAFVCPRGGGGVSPATCPFQGCWVSLVPGPFLGGGGYTWPQVPFRGWGGYVQGVGMSRDGYVQVVGTSPGHGPERLSTHPLLLTPNGSHHTYSRQVGEWNAFLFLQRSDLLMASLCLSLQNSHTKNGWYF